VLAISALTAAASGWARMQAEAPVTVAAPVGADAADAPPAMLGQFCARCHNDVDKVAGLSIDDLRGRDPAQVLRDLAAVRNPLYAQAHLRVASGNAPHDIT
ncbi:hypothetical protein LTR94_031718, partial [Friedmanniomyces endolithicus]